MEHHLTYQEQLNLFKNRGITDIDENSEKQINTIKVIGYYKLKQYAYVFWDKDSKQYENISFENLIKRYYRDQALKHEVFQAIGDIETALNSEISYILGENDPYLYLKFEEWCQRRGKNKYLKNQRMDKYKIKSEELSFLSQLQYQVKKSNYLDIQQFEKKNSNNIFPTVWLMVNTLTFGQSIHLLKLMSPDRRKKISRNFFHLEVSELIKGLELLNLIRNICCHNGDLIDISLKTMPKIHKKYQEYLNMDKFNYPHRLAIVVIMLFELMYPINPKYKFEYLTKKLEKLCNVAGVENRDKLAKSMGFKNYNSISRLLKVYKKRKTITFYPNGGYVYK